METMLQGFSRLAGKFGDFRQKNPSGHMAACKLAKGYLELEKSIEDSNNERKSWNARIYKDIEGLKLANERQKQATEKAENSASNYCTLFWVAVMGALLSAGLALVFINKFSY